jgi:hypothetical protein
LFFRQFAFVKTRDNFALLLHEFFASFVGDGTHGDDRKTLIKCHGWNGVARSGA